MPGGGHPSARPQLHDRKSLGGGDDRNGLVKCEGLGRPPFPPFPLSRGIDQHGDVAADHVIGFGVPDRAFQGEVAHGYRCAGVVGGQYRQCLPHVAGGELAELVGADDREDGLEDVLVLFDCLG